MKKVVVLFVCKGNSGRSQMAEAFMNQFSKKTKAISAGAEPDEKVHPWTVKVMKEIGLDVTRQKPKQLTEEMMKKANKIIIMDADLLREIPKQYSSKIETWQIEKLLGKSLESVRKIRNTIKKKVEQLIQEL
jgi:protein-tyrosine-phosphatase